MQCDLPFFLSSPSYFLYSCALELESLSRGLKPNIPKLYKGYQQTDKTFLVIYKTEMIKQNSL